MKTLTWIRQHQPVWMSALVVTATLALAGCATFSGPPEQVVQQRATEYWKARVTGNYAKAYALSTPSYRKLHTMEQFRMQFGDGASLKGAEPINTTCEPEKCTVRIKISAAPALVGMNLGTIATHLSETWLLEDGQWWRYQDL
ncbi:hypothetical protein CLU85_4037 [Acidovorax sp. 69]|uniref:hypothetical protein n=1 Tax=Acidovorax sp. 69 TaxID=2035202 RepID=UPI000C23BB0C|nr:hypothetical protein [Acidovorax sp. 69]PJI99195.1 hypothetical protein CLU85_4037 [Acidovorax sp. 69]